MIEDTGINLIIENIIRKPETTREGEIQFKFQVVFSVYQNKISVL